MRHLKCPHCHSTFANVKIEFGAVRCPNCGSAMFRYKLEGEDNLTPVEFMKLMDTRGADAAKEAMKWFPAKATFISMYAAGAFIGFIWPVLAQTFARKEDDESTDQPQPEPA